MKKMILLACMLLGGMLAMAQTPKWADIDYVGDGHVGHKLDIYVPEQGQAPFKPIIVIYGSAWGSNNKKDDAAKYIAPPLLKAGFAAITINHRSSDDVMFPGQIQDVKAAIRFIRANAEKYGLDASFVGITGQSSGAHLSSLAGTTNGVKEATHGGVTIDIEGNLGRYTNYSSRVDAVVDWFGPVDIPRMQICPLWEHGKGAIEALVGSPAEDHMDMLALLSPIYYLDQFDAPFMIVQGDHDNVVPKEQSIYFFEELQRVGLIEQLIIVPGGEHGPVTVNEDTSAAMAKFFLRQVEKRAKKK